MYKKNEKEWVGHLGCMAMDLLGFQAAYLLSYLFLIWYIDSPQISVYSYQALIILIIQLSVTILIESYSNILQRDNGIELLHVVRISVAVIVLYILYHFIVKEIQMMSRMFYLVMAVLSVLFIWTFRIVYKKCLQIKKGMNSGSNALIVFTYSHQAEEVVNRLLEETYNDYIIKGIYLMDKGMANRTEIQGIPLIHANVSLLESISHSWVDEAFFFLSPDHLLPQYYIENLLKMGITIHYSFLSLFEGQKVMQKTDKIGSFEAFTSSLKIVNSTSMAIKRTVDIIGGLVGCLLTAIIFIFIAPIIYIQSPGPIFFSQWRVGKNGRKFKIYKFRSMYMDAEERKKDYMAQNKMNGLMFKMDDDPRIIGSEKKDKNGRPKGIGNFIRKTSLDEFPQFWNVLVGDMSLVGTRPPTLDEWEQYSISHRARMGVKPGITGIWQVSGRSQITDFNEVVRLDTSYIREWSILLDVKIILKTIVVVLRGDGAV